MDVWFRSVRRLRRLTTIVVAAVMVMTMAVARAAAAPVIFTNEAAFDAAVAAAGIATAGEGFEGLAPGVDGEIDLGAFVLRPLFLNFISDDPADASEGTNSVFVQVLTFFPTFSFAQPIRAFSLDLIGGLDTGEDNSLVVSLGDQDYELASGQFPSGQIQFFGILDTAAPFTDLTFFSTGFIDVFSLDRVRFEDVSAPTTVPEPASLTLLGLGLLAVRRRLRRR